MPVKSQNIERLQQHGLQEFTADVAIVSNTATLHRSFPKQCALLKVVTDVQATVAGITASTLQIKDNAGAVVPLRNPAGTARKQTSIITPIGVWSENDAIDIAMDQRRAGGNTQIREKIYISAYLLDTGIGNQVAGDNFTITDTASDFGNITHTWVAGQEKAPAYMAAVAATLNADSDFATNYHADSIDVSADVAYLLIYRRGSGSAAMDYTEVGSWGGLGTDITGAGGSSGVAMSAAQKRAVVCGCIAARLAETAGFSIVAQADMATTDGLKLGAVDTDALYATANTVNEPFDIALTASSAGDVTVEQSALVGQDIVNGMEAGDQSVIAPAAGYLSIAEDDQLEFITTDLASAAAALDIQAHVLTGPVPGAKITTSKRGDHVEAGYSALRVFK